MTLHSAKGLEFPHVFMPGMEEGIFPHSRSHLDPQQMEEERRLAYVGMTRAKKTLIFLLAAKRTFYGGVQCNPPSRFLADIPREMIHEEDMMPVNSASHMQRLKNTKPIVKNVETKAASTCEFEDGDRVEHKEFGEGVVVDVRGDVVAIAFVNVGVKKIAASVAPLKKIGT